MLNAQISILLRIYRRTPKVMDLKTSLRKRYQIEENNRTMPLYLWISMNEILSAFAICAVFYFFKGINRKFVLLNENDSLADTIDMVSFHNNQIPVPLIILFSSKSCMFIISIILLIRQLFIFISLIFITPRNYLPF